MTRTLEVRLRPDIVYVSGAVNGASAIWTREGEVWQAIVPRAELDVYEVELTAINTLGTATEFRFTISYGLHLITDRTDADRQRVARLRDIGWQAMTPEQRDEYLHGTRPDQVQRGAYNPSDWRRVESAVQYLCGLLAALPQEVRDHAAEHGVAWDAFFEVPYDPARYAGLHVKTDWAKEDTMRAADAERYLSNVRALREALAYDTPALPQEMRRLRVDGANAIEKALEGLDAAIRDYRAHRQKQIENTQAAFFYSGELFAGEV